MKLSASALPGYVKRPEPDRAGVLFYGADPMRVALRRQALLKALVGENGEEEMRLTRLAGSDLRCDGAAVGDAMRAQSFFPGPRAVFVDGANDQGAPALIAALEDWQAGDATLVVTAGPLKKSSKLRKAFEEHANAYAAGIYNDPPGREEIEAALTSAGLTAVPPDAMGDLTALARALDPGDFAQFVEKLGLYKHGDTSPLTPGDITAVAPATTEAELDSLLHAVAEGQAQAIGPLMARLSGQGEGAVRLCIAATMHFRRLYTGAIDPGGPGSGLARARPPVFGPARDRMIRQAQGWGAPRLEQALSILTETDMTLRSAQKAPQMAVMERALIRLAMLGGRGRT
ncbi:DNA polymerase III subunit delta [Tropicimonas sp. S265A]|uniref:DNA polymerase III subunit delta n=1 Tax=Tropicimonas sp. S265A TaxID=3415134 RepID=UPI003C7A7D68